MMKWINVYEDFLLEGLSKETLDDYLEDWDQDRLEDWFGKNNHRLYLRLKKKVQDGEIEELVNDGEESQLKIQIQWHLDNTYDGQYEIDDYIRGLAIDKKNKNRPIRIGKIIQDKKLLQAFNDDPLRAGSRMSSKDPIICISKHPIDIALMSTGRGWTSCKELPNQANPEGGGEYEFVKEEVKVLLIAYLIYPDDKKIEQPIARVNLLPYYNKKGQTLYGIANRHYGELGHLAENFYLTIKDWLDHQQKDLLKHGATFVYDRKILPAEGPGVLFVGKLDLKEILEVPFFINDDGEIDVDGDVNLDKLGLKSILDEIGQFGHIRGEFRCAKNKLTDLKGSPRKVDWGFYCEHNQITTLKDGPKEVMTDYCCSSNQLENLHGAPDEVGGDFRLNNNRRLKSLEGGPTYVAGNYEIEYCPQLTTLDGIAETIMGNVILRGTKVNLMTRDAVKHHGGRWVL